MQKDEAMTIEYGLKERALHYYFLNRSTVYSTIAAFAAISILGIIYLTSGASANDATEAKILFERWKQAPSNEKIYREMRLSIKKIPGLERSLEAEIAQVLLSDGQFAAADALAGHCLSRLQEEAPLHAKFGYTSLLIEKKEFQKALESAVALKEEMERKADNRSSLYACNLLRIAFLQKNVSNGPGELCSWEEVKTVIATQGNSNAALFLKTNFAEKNFSLCDFISQRERSVSK